MWCIKWINSITGLYGIAPNISIMFLYTFYQPVFYATHDQHFPSESEEQAANSVGFGGHCGDAMTHKPLNKHTQKLYIEVLLDQLQQKIPITDLTNMEESLLHQQDLQKVLTHQKFVPTVFIRSRQDDAYPSLVKFMPEYNPDYLIGRAFLLPPQENRERLRAKVTKKADEKIEAEDGNRIPNINFIFDIDDGKVEELITYNQLLDHLEQAEDQETLWIKNSIYLEQLLDMKVLKSN